MADKNGTYKVYPEDLGTGPAPSSDQLVEAVYMLAHRLEKSEKRAKKQDKKIDELLKVKKKTKKKSKKKSSKGKKGKGSKQSPAYGLIQESASTALKITEMYAESKFFPDGRKNSKL